MKCQLNEKNCVLTIQPYTLNSTMRYYRSQECLESGISMLYSFENENPGYTVVGDACADIMIHYNKSKDDIGMDLVGPHDNLEFLELKEGYSYLGIRFLPGFSPKMAGSELQELKGEIIPLKNEKLFQYLLHHIKENDDFMEQCNGILNRLETQQINGRELGNSFLYQNVLEMILSSRKNHSLKELEEYSGYSARYLNKVFRERTGYSIMHFSNILRAQRVSSLLEEYKKLNIEPVYDMIAAELEYSDQSHMIREFRKYFGTTPKAYYQRYCR